MADTVRRTTAFQTLLADSAAAHSTNRQLLRDLAVSQISVVDNNTERTALFPSPVGDERVDNKATGEEELYDLSLARWRPFGPNRVIAQLAAPLRIYGAAGAADQTVISFTIPGNSIRPSSMLELDLLCLFVTPNHAGRTVKVQLGGQTLGQVFPTATMQSIAAKQTYFVSSDLQTIYTFSQSLNDVASPTAGQGAPFSSNTHNTSAITVDLTVDQTFVISMKPLNDDISELSGFSLRNVVAEYTPTSKIQVPTATAIFGDSLVAGTGSTGTFILTTTGTTTTGSAVITGPGSTAGVVAGQLISGVGIPANTTVLSLVGGITMSANATANGTPTITIKAGSAPQQLMYASPGRPVSNLGVGGETSSQILTRILRDKVRGRLWTPIFWMGRNDVGSGSFQTTVAANIAAAVANLAAGTKYIVNSVLPATTETTGSANLNAILALNAQLLATYPNNYVDLYSLLCTQGDGTVLAAYRGGDTVHLNDLGYQQVVNAWLTKLVALGT